jgi:thiol:disulfide interchange protein DsbD
VQISTGSIRFESKLGSKDKTQKAKGGMSANAPRTMAPHLFFIRSLFLFAGLCTSAWAQFGALVTQSTVSTPQVRAELVAHAPDGVQAGTTFWIGLQLQHTPEWHTYWRNPGDAGLPTELSFTLPKGFELGPVLWPLPEKIAVGRYTNYGFHKDVLLAVAVTVAPIYRAPGHRQVLVQLRANWLACRLECLRQEGQFVLKLPTQGSFVAHKNAFDWLLSQQPTQRLTPQRPAKFEDTVLVSTLQGLPPEWAGKKLSVFPLNPELLESATDQHPKASQEWQGEVLSVRLPASTTRTVSPQDISLLLVSGEGLLRRGVEVSVPVAGVWPASSAPARAPKAVVSSGSWIFSLTLVSALLGGLILNAALRVWLGPLRTPRARGVQIACLACLCWIGMSLFSILNTL